MYYVLKNAKYPFNVYKKNILKLFSSNLFHKNSRYVILLFIIFSGKICTKIKIMFFILRYVDIN